MLLIYFYIYELTRQKDLYFIFSNSAKQYYSKYFIYAVNLFFIIVLTLQKDQYYIFSKSAKQYYSKYYIYAVNIFFIFY